MSGTLVVVEGIDGSGKSTVARIAAELVAARGEQAVVVRPLVGDSDFVGGVKGVMRELPGTGWSRDGKPVEFFAVYFSYALVSNVHRVVLPAICDDAVVIADRWLWSHRANQESFGNDLAEFEELFGWLPEPDLAVWIEIPVEEAQRRIDKRRRNPGVGSGAEFLGRAHKALARFAAAGALLRYDGTRPPAELAGKLADEIMALREQEE